ncbi:hypothetical protein M431DRAFT_185802 [Trichoderma harzianum CBS 226.95]|uniref:Uncharacterized protein n=1 Tax=Trichoderma harzianum CBS 226.95 TaxID=983964 RepID=A0A2T4AU96_TRIHA|nr:hypothetical protein M431DRAFT_185802 [Trichoderma harzianum CBS 226.95]PTB60548.1 hypothetical protein M431DRAFT_185802 [Trichoderma harzianum CBS 226.95]
MRTERNSLSGHGFSNEARMLAADPCLPQRLSGGLFCHSFPCPSLCCFWHFGASAAWVGLDFILYSISIVGHGLFVRADLN